MLGVSLARAKRRLIGPPERLPQRALTALIVLSIAVAAGGGWYAVSSGVSTGTSSLPYLRPILAVVTSVWAWLVGLVWLLRRVLIHRDQRYADQAAEVTGYEPRSVRRLAYEAKSPDGATRVIASTGDEPAAIEDRIDTALEDGEDDRVKLNPDAFATPNEPDADPFVWVEDTDADGAGAAEPSERSLVRRVGVAVLRVGKVVGAAVVALAAWHGLVAYGPTLGLGLVPAAVLAAAESTLAYAGVVVAVATLVAGRELWRLMRRRRDGSADASAGASADASAGGTAGDDQPDGDLEDEAELRDPWREDLKLFRLDLASTLNFSELTWQLLLPAGATVALLLLAVQLWVQPWLYPAIFAAGVLVGVGNYLRVSWKRTRRLEALRRERETVDWSDVAILVKEVEVPETRIYYAWMGDSEPRRYAHDDRQEFAEAVAHRAYELIEGVPVSPSVMEKQVDELEDMHPDLHGFRDTEKERIMTWLLEHVESAQHGLIPKAKLIEDAVEHDRQDRRFGPGTRGKGFDPVLVRESYRELVPAALVEQEVDVTREDVDGDTEELTVTAVRLRTDPLPPEYGQIRAAFSSKFGNYARWSPMYELPDVSDRLEGEPEYITSLGARGEPA